MDKKINEKCNIYKTKTSLVITNEINTIFRYKAAMILNIHTTYLMQK